MVCRSNWRRLVRNGRNRMTGTANESRIKTRNARNSKPIWVSFQVWNETHMGLELRAFLVLILLSLAVPVNESRIKTRNARNSKPIWVSFQVWNGTVE